MERDEIRVGYSVSSIDKLEGDKEFYRDWMRRNFPMGDTPLKAHDGEVPYEVIIVLRPVDSE